MSEEIIKAAKRNDIKAVKKLVEMSAYENKYKALRVASFLGHTKIVGLLLANGVDVNETDFARKTPLNWASTTGKNETVKLLLAKKADANIASNSGSTAIMNASERGHKKIVELLLANDAKIDLVNNDGNTALMLASSNAHTEIVELIENHKNKKLLQALQPIKQSLSTMTDREIVSPDTSEMLLEKVHAKSIPQLFYDLNTAQQSALFKVFLPKINKDKGMFETIKCIMKETHKKSRQVIDTAKQANFYSSFRLQRSI